MMFSNTLMFGDNNRRKRGRDDDEEYEDDDGGNGGVRSFGEHRHKRLQCLPLRTSPTSQKRWSGPPAFPSTSFTPAAPLTITPQDSDSDEPQQHHASDFSAWASSQTLPQSQREPSPLQAPWADDMMMDAASPTTDRLDPGPFHPEPVAPTIAGRMPTPILPNFAAQLRIACGSPDPAAHPRPHGIRNMGHHPGFGGGADERSVPRTMETADSDWHTVQTRRLPSPISEGEDMFSPPGNLASPGMVLDTGFSNQLHARPQIDTFDARNAVDTMGMMDLTPESPEPTNTTTLTLSHSISNPETSSAPATPSSGHRGHIRSRHTVNSWTWQPGMKKSFSIGYRADCEKCRLRVPGHFNHIIVS